MLRMRLFPCLLTLSLCLVFATNSEAGRRGRRQRAAAEASLGPTAPLVNPADPPSANLTRFLQAHIAALTDITPEGESGSVYYRTGVSLLRAAFQSQSSTAPPEKKPTYTAALRACDVLGGAIDERDKAAADYASAQAGSSPQDIKDVRISTVPARHGYGKATRANNAKEESANTQPDANQSFMNSAALTAWTTRVAQLRQQIDAAYAQEVATEQAAPSTSATPTASPQTGD